MDNDDATCHLQILMTRISLEYISIFGLEVVAIGPILLR
jgi:hypothetical protein